MQTIKQLIKAPTATSQGGYISAVGGRTFLIQSCDGGDCLNVALTDAQGNRYSVQGVGPAFKASPATGFVSVEIATSIDANVAFIVTQGEVELQLANVTTTVTNSAANPVPVTLVSEPGAPVQVSAPPSAPVNVAVQGTVNVSGATLTATNVGINNDAAHPVPVSLVSEPGAPVATLDTKALTVATVAAVVVAANATGTALLAADATRRAVRFFNRASSAGPVAIVPAAADAYAAAAIVLNPGDFWNETDAPGAAWYASTPAATGAAVNLQTVKA
ncbi:Uncharacterised protein [Burkholderia pseudomallei]|uniref:hypothetical protein n=1 Tax=Burkholderia pseudomallei TaxID=28450 RepID=UPI000F046437|nr:hypothetical protein [Burkholderia pseudomallei]VBY45458.1 Uncharacterised protein [Burkholderia pseudomallei]VBY69280.1 Uncharacterised protein [Burkholderia pseudomallei]VBY76719.1 Uncharacterised protein [Burkholderia pseudomallei]VBY84447.1 Uncharacterised protein [Burkholderia pseudomallei]